MKKIVLYGAGGLGREAAGLIEYTNYINPNTYELMGFLVDEKYYKEGAKVHEYPVLGTADWLRGKSDVYCICTIADVFGRKRVMEKLSAMGTKFETLIAEGVIIPPSSQVGKGCVIFGYSLISSDCRIGDGVFINTYVSVGHDVVIGEYSSIMTGTGISGWVEIGEQVNIGGHAFIVPKKKIGDRAVVAAGSVVFSNVKTETTVLGNPARRMRELEA